MAERARSSVMTKQEALTKLMSSDPSLMSSFDDELLASITLASDPAARSNNKRASAAAAKHTLIDPRVSYRQSTSTSNSKSSGRASVRYSNKTTECLNVRLYSAEDTDDAQKAKTKQQILFKPSVVSTSSSSTNMKKNEDATTIKDDAGRERSNAVTRESARYPQKMLVSLLDEGMFTERGTLKVAPQAQQRQQQKSLPPSIAPVARKSISPSRKRTTNNSKKANNRRHAQPVVPPSLLASVEQQYEFGRSTSYSSDLDVTDQSAVESTHSSSHGSNESDESCISMSSVSMQESNGAAATYTNSPPSSISRQKSSQMVLDHRCFVTRDQWVVKSSRRCCAVCERDFNVLVRKRHSCRMCGEVICSRCSVFRAVNLSVIEGKCRICSCCSVSYRKKLEDLVSNGSSNATSGVSSDPTVVSTAVDREFGSMESNSTLTSDQQSSSEPAKLTASSLSNLITESTSKSLLLPLQPSQYDSDLSALLSCDYSSYSSASLSSSSDGLSSFSSFSPRNIEEELEAALKARQLEKEVEASRNRIQELEVKIQDQENQKELLSSEQQNQLNEARSMIQQLQEKLRQQELSAREAAVTRDTICLTNLRQIEVYTSDDEESRALKKKLKILERQLQQAGINVAEVIPYEVAKAKVAEIARRLQEIGSSELVLDDKQAQAAARKEYYKLEQDMEKYNTALVMTDEYIEEERRKEALFEEENREANERALLLLRSAIPVNISRLSEQQLRSLTTPSSATFPADLAKRLKRTNVLQLLRVDPKNIVRMHPSVIEGHRTTGLTLLERRALHVVMQKPFQEWKRQQMDEMSQKKFQWYKKLIDGLASAVRSYNQHCEMSSTEEEPAALPAKHSCKLLGLSCPVRAEEKIEALYAVGLGFPQTAAYFEQEIIKSDPEGAGEKALQEAQSYAREMIANQRQRELKTHYKMNMREVAQAMGALEEMDAILERIKTLDAAFRLPAENANNNVVVTVTNDCDALLQASRELVLLLAKRAGICIVGKRNRENDQVDMRSPVELQVAVVAVQLLCLLTEDIRKFHSSYSNSGSVGTLRYVNELLEDVKEKNAVLLIASQDNNGSAAECKRVPWKERSSFVVATETATSSDPSAGNDAGGITTATLRIPSSSSSSTAPARPPAVLPTSASLFDAIRARKQLRNAETGSSEPVSADSQETKKKSEAVVAAKPVDLLAAIRARRCKAQVPVAAAEGTTSA